MFVELSRLMAGSIALAISAVRDWLGFAGSKEDEGEDAAGKEHASLQDQERAAAEQESKPSTSGQDKGRVFTGGPDGFTFYDVFFWR